MSIYMVVDTSIVMILFIFKFTVQPRLAQLIILFQNQLVTGTRHCRIIVFLIPIMVTF